MIKFQLICDMKLTNFNEVEVIKTIDDLPADKAPCPNGFRLYPMTNVGYNQH